MSSRRLAAIVSAFALAGCGGSSSTGTSSFNPATTAPTASTAGTAAARTPAPHRRRAPQHHRRTPTATTPTAPAAGPPAATPAAPDGLRAASGYGSYDDCQGSCGGAVPASLRRPLHLPSAGASCPASASHAMAGMSVLGSASVGPAQAPKLSIASFIGSVWGGARVSWIAAASYHGPVLIRGRQLGGRHAVGFGSGHVPVDELQLLTPVSTSAGARQWPSFTRVRGPGCFAYQIDGTSFSAVVVFRAA